MQKYLSFNNGVFQYIRNKPKQKLKKVEWQFAPDIKKRLRYLIKMLDLNWINANLIICMRSNNSSSRAYARIWGLSKIWQISLGVKPHYIIEVLSEKFDKLSHIEKDRVIIHEITHIPRNFSGSLLPHIRKKGKSNFNSKVDNIYNQYLKVNK